MVNVIRNYITSGILLGTSVFGLTASYFEQNGRRNVVLDSIISRQQTIDYELALNEANAIIANGRSPIDFARSGVYVLAGMLGVWSLVSASRKLEDKLSD